MRDFVLDLPSLQMVLAQTTPGVPGTSGAPAATATTPSVPGAATGEAAPAGPAGKAPAGAAPGIDLMLIMFLVLIVMIVMTSLAGRKQRKAREAMLRDLRRGDRVSMAGGMIGTVAELYDTELVLRVDEQSNTRIRFRRSAVESVMRSSGEGASGQVESKPAGEPAAAR